MSDPNSPPDPGSIDFGSSGDDSKLFPSLSLLEWLIFGSLAAILAATNIYTTLLIGWGDTGSIVAVLAAFLLLGGVLRKTPSVQTLNLGQTMASAGGSVGFAVASYAAVYIAKPDFRPSTPALIALFIAMGMLGAIVGTSVRKYMVRYFFPSGTACAVIQTSVARKLAPGERNRPVWMLKVWGGLAMLLTLPGKLTAAGRDGKPFWSDINFNAEKGVGLGIDPLFYGIGIVVGPRVGAGMLLGSLAVPFLIVPRLAGGPLEAETGDWVKWIAIAVLTLPTFATILFAYLHRVPPSIPPGFTPGRTQYAVPSNRQPVYGMVGIFAAVAIAYLGQSIFGLSMIACLIVMAVAWPLCIVNGRVAGDTDINPVRLVAIVMLSVLFGLVDRSEVGDAVIPMLGMAVIGGTLASVAVDMFQDYRTGYLVDANPTHQTMVQFVGVVFGSLAAIPVVNMLIGELGIGEGSNLPAPGATIWAAMAEAMAGGFEPSSPLKLAVILVSVIGCGYAYLTVWPKTAPWMPSIFGLGLGLLLGIHASAAIFAGGVLKWLATLVYTSSKAGDELTDSKERAGNDTMLVGASIFAASALISIGLVIVKKLFDELGWSPFDLAH